jgi:hypothetical protein
MNIQIKRELDKWLIQNQPQVQYMLENDNIKELLYQVYEAGTQCSAVPRDLTDEEMRDLIEEKLREDQLTSYSSILAENL